MILLFWVVEAKIIGSLSRILREFDVIEFSPTAGWHVSNQLIISLSIVVLPTLFLSSYDSLIVAVHLIQAYLFLSKLSDSGPNYPNHSEISVSIFHQIAWSTPLFSYLKKLVQLYYLMILILLTWLFGNGFVFSFRKRSHVRHRNAKWSKQFHDEVKPNSSTTYSSYRISTHRWNYPKKIRISLHHCKNICCEWIISE